MGNLRNHLGLLVFMAMAIGTVLSQNDCDEEDRDARYRRPDGSCNNINRPNRGKAGQRLRRMLDNDYDDGLGTAKTHSVVPGETLPSARTVSREAHSTVTSNRADISLMVMQWGQFLDHDISFTLGSTEPGGGHISCTCGSTDDVCFNIPLDGDSHFTTAERDCMEFTRSHGQIGGGGVRQQINAITAWIDASNVYGSDQAELESVQHSHQDGELGFRRTTQGRLLPENDDDFDCRPNENETCSLAGDVRVNEQPGLTAMHTIFMRQHNRIARFFKRNTDWDDDTIFEETRKIVEAINQKITYSDFLPLLLSPTIYNNFKLGEDEYNYKPNRDPRVFNAFATAAYRFGHTLIPEHFTIGTATVSLQDTFFSPTQISNHFTDVVKALQIEKSMAVDEQIADSVQNHLFQNATDHDGFDLAALNIQRGRDHGLPGYNAYREKCGLDRMDSLEDLYGANHDAIGYEDIDDVDLFSGGLAEGPSADGGLLGDTFQCILARQFRNLKEGDRFFYLNQDETSGLTEEQIAEINKITLAKVICDNTENDELQANIFLPEDPINNPLTDCKDLEAIKLCAWTQGEDSDEEE